MIRTVRAHPEWLRLRVTNWLYCPFKVTPLLGKSPVHFWRSEKSGSAFNFWDGNTLTRGTRIVASMRRNQIREAFFKGLPSVRFRSLAQRLYSKLKIGSLGVILRLLTGHSVEWRSISQTEQEHRPVCELGSGGGQPAEGANMFSNPRTGKFCQLVKHT